jgi:outer membrane receptor for ferrienterochelin and colicins
VLVGLVGGLGARWTAGVGITRPLPGAQTLRVGAEFIDNFEQDQTATYVNDPVPFLDIDNSSAQRAVYAQDEIKLGQRFIVNAGLRYDGYKQFNKVSPRAALIFLPSATQSIKYLYGNAFRAPNVYEKIEYYFGPSVASLRPESIDTHEVVWERYTADWLRTSVSSYWYKADNLITLRATDDPAAFLGVTYVNEGEVRAKGLEVEAQMRLWKGAEGHMSYALQEAIDQATGTTLPNSPRQMGKARVSAPLFGPGSSLAVEVLGIGRRQTISGNYAAAAATANVTLIKPLGQSLEFVGTIRNLFNVEYAVPASQEHVQDTIPQNGRTFRVGLRVKLPL